MRKTERACGKAALAAIASLCVALAACGGRPGGDEPQLAGNIGITPSGAYVGDTLSAAYDGEEDGVSLQWNRNGQPIGEPVSGKISTLETTAAGSYTVTASASGYEPKTSPPAMVSSYLPFTVRFHLHGGNPHAAFDPIHFTAPGTVQKPAPDPEQDGFKFAGWHSAQDGGAPITFPLQVSEDTNIHAQWEELPPQALSRVWHTADTSGAGAGSTNEFLAVAWGGSGFVAGGRLGPSYTSGRTAHSPDGEIWTNVTNSSFNPMNVSVTAVASNGSVLVAGGSGGRLAYSTDGATWTQATTSFQPPVPTYIDIDSITWGDGRFLAVLGDRIAQSADGMSWTEVLYTGIRSGSYLRTIVWADGVFVAGGNWTSGAPSYYPLRAYSTDGIAWTDDVSGYVSNGVFSIAWGDGVFVAGESDGRMAYSNDGRSWTQVADSPFGSTAFDHVYALAWGGGMFVAGGSAGAAGALAYSRDGINWTLE
ncbi:MAG: InlB B-repeat-containing protein, partial [Treponema sp.]|nr:InlB B-repeat-containing protein [Treponema sp.]